MNPDEMTAFIRARCGTLDPQPVPGLAPLLPVLRPRAVLFDVYGTLLVSAAGDIGSASPLSVIIARHHAEARAAGIDWPEVDIRAIWREAGIAAHEVDRVAIEHELAVNPVWPMPGFPSVLRDLSACGIRLGIVSNAQFYTPYTLAALAGSALAEMGLDERLCVWSFEQRRAKPSVWLYREAAHRLAEQGIAPGEVLMVGNSARKDVAPAQVAGFRAALFAGDARSYEPGDGVHPDAVVTALAQLLPMRPCLPARCGC